ncbi:MAG: YbhB/YbcL family Raf kinase inhibitor-like protein [Parcubacteria group bacterium]|nr:YbhB/YbcL family Raf kinase inhibitor-like protein [Parcubacteria group bacterium]
MKLTSSVFTDNEKIPSLYTCDGGDYNPQLMISDVPHDTQSLALIVDDPDAPRGVWTHWTLWNIDPRITEIKEKSVPNGATQGITSFGSIGYGGPCPPNGEHRYFFKLYALDTKLDLPSSTNAAQLVKAMEGHILASVELVGLYKRE